VTTRQRPAGREPRTTYDSAVQDFDHERLASLPAYGTLRQALSDLGNEIGEIGGMELADWLAAVRDMTATGHCGDMCVQCDDEHRRMWWPNAVERSGQSIRGRYRCDHGHEWGCSWPVSPLRLE
jgi:hypothetical protein